MDVNIDPIEGVPKRKGKSDDENEGGNAGKEYPDAGQRKEAAQSRTAAKECDGAAEGFGLEQGKPDEHQREPKRDDRGFTLSMIARPKSMPADQYADIRGVWSR